jgi:hypothetical protein
VDKLEEMRQPFGTPRWYTPQLEQFQSTVSHPVKLGALNCSVSKLISCFYRHGIRTTLNHMLMVSTNGLAASMSNGGGENGEVPK